MKSGKKMNKIFFHKAYTLLALASLLVLFPFTNVFAQKTGTSQVKFNTTSHDFGKIKEIDGPVSFTFTFTNTSKTPYIIDFISVSCGCTTPEYSKAPVLPGKTGKIKITYDPAGRPGVFNRTSVITSNNRKDQVKLVITGDVIGKPRSVEDDFPVVLSNNLRATSNTMLFGYTARGTQKAQSIDIYNSGTAPIKLGYQVKEKTMDGTFRIGFNPTTLPPKGRGQLTFTYDLKNADVWGLLFTTFALTANGQPTTKNITAYATATDDFSKWSEAEKAQAPRAVFSSQFHHFGNVKKGATLNRDFELTNTGQSPLIIREVTANSKSVTFSLPKRTIAPGETIQIKVGLKASNTSERMSESISLVVNDPARPLREIRVGANVE